MFYPAILNIGTEDVPSKRAKVTKSIKFVHMLEFVATHPLIHVFEFKAGFSKALAGVGSIDPPEIVDKTTVGASLADGYVQKLSIAHDKDKSWGGGF